ncbi:uncharacterized protein LOC133650087 [Entelurus aequoreus]|uniref:uncharacterized protein LOC133650087 n=1 Tax=Entelurus aequoreus TaxID=161455 RepID=UPI002B1E4013|nr:uncharacterized protein LOC133650087 [Entelurus aequoreus]
MKMLTCLVFLFASFSSAATDDECSPLTTPLSLDDRHKLVGTRTFISGYTDHDVYNAILNITQGSLMTFNESTLNDKDMFLYEEMKMNGTCYGTKLNISIDHNLASATMGSISSTMHFLPTCEGCQVLSINSTARDMKTFLESFHIYVPNNTDDEMKVHALYLFASGDGVKDSDLDYFNKQAHCLGFSGEVNFVSDPKEGSCAGSKVIMLN